MPDINPADLTDQSAYLRETTRLKQRVVDLEGEVERLRAFTGRVHDLCDLERAELVDRIDMQCDEFQRIRACPGADEEIRGLCDRAIKDVRQHVHVIVQRDNAERERDKLRAKIERLRAGLGRIAQPAAGTHDFAALVRIAQSTLAAEKEKP